jgi:hypothetical protein
MVNVERSKSELCSVNMAYFEAMKIMKGFSREYEN